ncbi:MAG: ATP-binding cassette domain-containing protein [Thiomargarita sp.]|nr:ATP-binding cassette domain-containing protein [Thiomargarita sp.]
MIRLRNLSLQRGIKPLFEQVNLTIHAGQKIGIIGVNGCGKSSLFTLLLNQLHQDSGDIDLPTNLVIAHVAQTISMETKPAIEYVLDGDQVLRKIQSELIIAQKNHDGMREANLHAQFDEIDGYTAEARAAQLMYGLGFEPQEHTKPVNEFSGGWRIRLNLAQTLICRSDLLLLDEPSNHLDLDAVLWLENWLRQYSGTLLLISHDRDFLDNVIDSIAHIEQQTINLYTGNYEDFELQYAEKLALQQASYQKQQREIKHIQNYVERFRYKATKAKQAQSRIKALARMEKIAPAHVNSPFHFQFKLPVNSPHQLLTLDKVDIGYEQTLILKQVNLQITAGSRIGLLGANGAGKSTLIKVLARLLNTQQGECIFAEELKIGYFAQHQLEQLDENSSPLEHLRRLEPPATEQVMRNFLGGFNFIGDMAVNLIKPFSGGEKARLALALLIWQQPNLLLLDEPTNHLDLEMRHALTLALSDYTGALILVSHDRHLLRTTTEQLLLVANGGVTQYDGDLSDYRQWLLDQKSQKNSQHKNQKLQKQVKIQQRERSRNLQNRLKNLEKQLDQLTDKKAKIEAQLSDPKLYDSPENVQQYVKKQANVTKQLQQVEEDWLEIIEELESL